jgi:ABC-2 type transport system permease protein
VSNAIPVTYFMNILRGVIVRGAGFADLWIDVLAPIIISTILLTIATPRFRKNVM